jgi:hypothetical protein
MEGLNRVGKSVIPNAGARVAGGGILIVPTTAAGGWRW